MCFMSLSIGGLVCLMLWPLVRWEMPVSLRISCDLPRSPFFSISYTTMKGTAVSS